MAGPRSPAARRDRTALIRHFALCLAAGAAFLWPQSARTSNEVIWLLALVILLNLGAAALCRWTGRTRVFSALSSALGLSGWCTLACVTGGLSSPFVAGLWLEILLSALAFPCLGTVLVALGSGVALLGAWWVSGPGDSLRLLLLQEGFVAVMGAVAALVTCRWQDSQDEVARREAELGSRLTALEEELETTRRMGQVGESAARFAHGMKNAIHALRGYAALMHEREATPAPRRALDGMNACLDRLEEATRQTLGSGAASSIPPPAEDFTETKRTIEEVIREVSLSYPGIRWRRQLDEPLPAVAAPGGVLHEALLNLARNAAEAMQGQGEVFIETRAQGSNLEIAVRDQGRGLDEAEIQRLFTPGHTTKSDGSGFGLFLTRKLLESCGGCVKATSERGKGSFFAIGLPLRRS